MDFGIWSVVASAAGFYVAQRFIPDFLPVIPKASDLIAGAVVAAIGYFVKVPILTAFGVGIAVEGVLRLMGL
jgi:hypothetical protein